MIQIKRLLPNFLHDLWIRCRNRQMISPEPEVVWHRRGFPGQVFKCEKALELGEYKGQRGLWLYHHSNNESSRHKAFLFKSDRYLLIIDSSGGGGPYLAFCALCDSSSSPLLPRIVLFPSQKPGKTKWKLVWTQQHNTSSSSSSGDSGQQQRARFVHALSCPFLSQALPSLETNKG